MNKELAKIIALTAFRSAADLGNLIPLLKEHCSEEEYRSLGMAIAKASAEISQQVLKKIYDAHPELEIEFAQQVRKYGRPV